VKWVTREYVAVNRTGCPWLIKKFIDKDAEFIFVPPEKVEDVVQKERAIPFDVPNVDGAKCFTALVEKYKIKEPEVLELAKIVRGEALEGAGLRAIIAGISIAAKDDHEAIAKASLVFDALYTNSRLKIIREEYKSEIEKMDRKQQREFLRKKLMG